MPATTEQMMANLEYANQVRVGIARVRKEILAMPKCDAALLVADLLESDTTHQYFGYLSVFRALDTIRSIGRVKIAWIVREAGVLTGDRKIRDLTPRQRHAIASLLRERVTTDTHETIAA